jgi:hypothetical protein
MAVTVERASTTKYLNIPISYWVRIALMATDPKSELVRTTAEFTFWCVRGLMRPPGGVLSAQSGGGIHWGSSDGSTGSINGSTGECISDWLSNRGSRRDSERSDRKG